MFKLNVNLAKGYDQRGGFISEAGKYVGTIESVIYHVGNNANGRSENLILKFVTDNKQKASFLINTSYHNGTINEGGIKLVNAILTVLSMRESGDPQPATVREYDPNSKQEVSVTKQCFVNMHGKRMGIVVQMELNNNSEYPRPTIYSVFNAENELTASEILDKRTEPVRLANIMAFIATNPVKDKRSLNNAFNNTYTPPTPPQQPVQQQGNVQPQGELDSDIPF